MSKKVHKPVKRRRIITKTSLRKWFKQQPDSRLRSTYAALHSKTGIKGAQKILDMSGSKVTVAQVLTLVKSEMNKRKRR